MLKAPEILFEEFDLLLDALNSVQKMRELILQLAVQGKLVPQDPRAESAENLLQKLKKARQKQVDTGRAKPARKHQNFGEAQGLYEIPHNWRWEFLARVPLWPLKDGDWVESKDQNPSGDVRLVQLADIGARQYRDRSTRFMTSEKAVELSCTYLEVGDVLIARLPEPLGRACIFPGDGKRCVTVVDVAICRCDSNFISNRYLILALNCASVRRRIEEYAIGTTRKRVSTGNLGKIEIPVPPLEEQKRIVEKVDQLMKLCDELEQQKNKAAQTQAAVNVAALDRLTSAENDDKFAESQAFINDNFDLLHRVPENVRKLRQTILQLAGQGKLVSQDPNDEPASELLKKIRAEKEKLIKEGKIKKQKPLPPVFADEIPYELPPGWEWVRLGQLGETQTGTTPSKKHPEYFGGSIAFIKPADISDKGINYENEMLTLEGLEEGRLVKSNSLMMVCIGGSTGKAFYTDRDCSCNQQINVLTPLQNMSSRLFYYLTSSPYFQTKVWNQSSGSATNIINKLKWASIPVPLPPLPEQKRIVQKVDQLMELCDELESKLQQSQKDSEILLQSVLHETLTARSQTAS